MVEFGNDWDELLKDEFKKDYYLRLRQFLINEYNHGRCQHILAAVHADDLVTPLRQQPAHGPVSYTHLDVYTRQIPPGMEFTR